MRVAEFAEIILHGTSLDEKLLAPGPVDFESEAAPLQRLPALPGRPPALRFLDQQGSRPDEAAFPTRSEMEQDSGRGRVMHFFANHELLALELMALMLLRFPDASPAFQKMIVRTMRDEQRHLSLYLARMRELGVSFGEIAVGRFFWDCLRESPSPLAFLAGMSLTFEQANLDFCLQYRSDMEEIGDEATRRVLDEVYRDEIGHVAFGWELFERERPGAEEAFDEYQRLLAAPLTPRHGRGGTFSREAREKAGLSPTFIEAMEVYSASRGRVPDVYLFNPDCEGEILRPGHVPSRAVDALARDLDALPAVFAGEDDIVLVRNKPPSDALLTLKRAGFMLPSFQTREQLEGRDLMLGAFRPWGSSPDAARALGSSKGLFREAVSQESANGLVHRKSFAAVLAGSFADSCSDDWVQFLAPPGCMSMVARTESEVGDAVHALKAKGHANLVIKADLGASGRNMIRLLDEEIDTRVRSWLVEVLVRHSAVVVEPWLDRVADLSLHINVNEDGGEQRGMVHFLADRRGQFRGAYVGHALPSLAPELKRWFHETMGREALDRVLQALTQHVGEALRDQGYRGPAGIDMLVYREAGGALRLRPLVEINPRWTMGRLALALRLRVQGGPAFFEIERFATTAAIQVEVKRRHAAWPVKAEGQGPARRLIAGWLPLVPVRDDTQYLASLWVGDAARSRLGRG